MRRVVGAIALLLLLAFFVSLIIFPAGASPSGGQEGNGSVQAQLLLRSAEIADAGEGAGQAGAGDASSGDAAGPGGSGKVAVLRLQLYSNAPMNASAFCSPLPLQKNVLILSFPSVPGTERNLSAMLSAALSQSGISSRAAGVDDALSSQNALIFAPTGAIPLPLLQNASALAGANSRVVVLQSLPGKAIDEDGSIVQQNGSVPKNIEIVNLPASGASSALSGAVAHAAFLPGAPRAGASALGNFTLFIPINSTVAHCRAIVAMEGGKYRFSDSAQLTAPPGSLAGPARLAAGEDGVFEFSLPGSDEVGRTLRFFAVAYSPSGEAARREIAGGEIRQGWASRFAMNFSHGGKYVLRIADQFGRVHAAAFVQVPALDVLPVSAEGNRYEFLMLQDGEPANGAISARLDNGTAKNYSVQSGKLVIWAAPASGSHTLHFDFAGSKSDYPFTAQQSGAQALLDTYLRFGVPAAIFVLAVFLLLRAGRRAKYSITFPEAAPCEPEVVEVQPKGLVDAYARADGRLGGFSLPCYPHEIAAQLGGKGSKRINQQSALRLLRKLAQQGIFAEHEGAFVPASRMGGFSARELLMLRAIHECMLERGLRFIRKPVIPVKGSGLEIALFRERESVLEGMGKACRAVAFESGEELAKFQRELFVPGPQSSRIRLALENDKVIFVVASHQGLGSVLP